MSPVQSESEQKHVTGLITTLESVMISLKNKLINYYGHNPKSLSATNAVAYDHLDCSSLASAGFPCRLFFHFSTSTSATKRIADGNASFPNQNGCEDERIWRYV
jgi:hypothetical protein